MLVNVKIGPKLIGGFTAVAAIGVVLGLVGLTAMAGIKDKADEVTDQVVPQLTQVANYSMGISAIRRFELGMVVAKFEKDEALVAKYKAEVAKALEEEVKKPKEAFERVPRSAEAEKLYSEMKVDEAAYMVQYNQVVALVDAGLVQEAAKLSVGESRNAYNALIAVFAKLDERVSLTAEARATEVGVLYATRRLFIVGAIVAALALALVLGVRLTRSLAAPIAEVAARAERLQSVCISELERGLNALTRGDTTVDVELTTTHLSFTRLDEVGQVARTVDNMIGKARASIASYTKLRSVVGALVAETRMLSQAGREGRLATRGRSELFSGSFHDLVQGVNETLDAVILPVNEAADVLDRVAGRDLTARVVGNYQGDHARIKDALNRAVIDLGGALGEVAGAAEQVASASGQIANSAQSLAQGSSEQASSIEEVSSSLHEMTSMAQQSATNARDARGMADSAKATTLKGVESMKSLSGAVNQIKASAERTAKIVKTIDEIAFQTNLLALNAAVEAARAGEAGKGFAVVADEVRALAIRAAEAAKQTAELLEESGKYANNGVIFTAEVVKNLDDIAIQAQKVSDVMSEISAASEQQEQGVSQVNDAIEQMNTVTQQVAANAEESASAAEELSSQSEHMRAMLGQFTLESTDARPVLRSAAPRRQAPVRSVARKSSSTKRVSVTNDDDFSMDDDDAKQLIHF